MRKILLLLFLTVSTLLSSQMGIVTGLDPNGDGFLSLRKKPKSTEIGRLYNGNKVKIFKKSGKYYKVEDIKSGKTGWAHSNWIKKTQKASNSTSYASRKGTVYGLDPNGDGFLSVRNKPKGRKIGKLYNGSKVTILATRGKWYKVNLNYTDLEGWAHGNWIRVTNSGHSMDVGSVKNKEMSVGDYLRVILKRYNKIRIDIAKKEDHLKIKDINSMAETKIFTGELSKLSENLKNELIKGIHRQDMQERAQFDVDNSDEYFNKLKYGKPTDAEWEAKKIQGIIFAHESKFDTKESIAESRDDNKKKKEKRKVSNATSNNDEMECSEIADWLMKDMPDSFKEACSKKNKQTENSTNPSSWKIPDKKSCLDNGGEIDINGICKSTWENAQKICIENKSSLATINELENLVTSCGGNIDQNNKDNVSYHKCYKEKGFADDLDYWSSSLTEISHTPRMVHVSLGSVYSGGKFTSHSVICFTK